MALIFPRLARNFVKNGYFPTDNETLNRIKQALVFDGCSCRLLDPCCGEGAALSEIRDALAETGDRIETFGVEYNRERAWEAKKHLDHCIHGDLRDCMIGARQFGLLFLNPPYGDAVADKGQLSDTGGGRLRLEKEFYRRTHGLLQYGGVMVLIIPYYTLDKEFSTWIARHFYGVQAYMAPEQEFQQAVIFGIKHKITDRWASTDAYRRARSQLIAIGSGDTQAEVLPEAWTEPRYQVPEAPERGKFHIVRLDGEQLAEAVRDGGLWTQYDQVFGQSRSWSHRRPLCDVSDWHLALMLAAGQVSGVVKSRNGRIFVIRGDTYKEKVVTTSHEANAKGNMATVRTHTDVFVPSIRGLDMTPGSPTFGEVFTIK